MRAEDHSLETPAHLRAKPTPICGGTGFTRKAKIRHTKVALRVYHFFYSLETPAHYRGKPTPIRGGIGFTRKAKIRHTNVL